MLSRRGARVVERGGLENRCGLWSPRVRIPAPPLVFIVLTNFINDLLTQKTVPADQNCARIVSVNYPLALKRGNVCNALPASIRS